MVTNMIKKLLTILLFLTLNQSTLAGQTSLTSYADIVAPLIPAVVNITAEQKETAPKGDPQFPEGFEDFRRFFEYFGQLPGMDDDEGSENRSRRQAAAGSGFIISADGYIVTNHHVVENCDKITVKLSNDQKLEAKLIGSDSRTDLALLKVESKTPLNYVKFGNSEESRVGDIVIAIGNPFGLGSTVTSGIISAQARDINTHSGNIIDNFIQTDASINRGNSGGPMFNIKGEVIGINFAIYSPTGGSVGVGFAVPSSVVKPIIDQLMKTGKVHHGWLGVAIQSTEDIAEGLGLADGVGALVSSVTPGSPAEKAGIAVGDIILKFDGKEITSNRRLPRIVAETPVGKKVPVELMSKGKTKNITITVGESNGKLEIASVKDSKTELFGMNLSAINDEIKNRYHLSGNVPGIIVTHVERKSVAGKLGIKKGDIISAINQQNISNPEEAIAIVKDAKAKKRKSVMIQLYRLNKIIFLTIPL